MCAVRALERKLHREVDPAHPSLADDAVDDVALADGGADVEVVLVRPLVGDRGARTEAARTEVAGIVVERDNPNDARSKLVELSADMRHKLDGFFDAAVSRLRATSRRVDVLGPSPEEP